MKKTIALFLALTMCVFAFFGCGEGTSSNNDQSQGQNSLQNDDSIDASHQSDAGNENSNEDISGENSSETDSEYPKDVLEDLPYTIVCTDKYNNGALVEDYQFTDDGRLNDGLYRSQSDLENESNQDMQVNFKDTSSYNFQITFESNGAYDGYRIIAHNCDLTFSFLKIEMGTDLDNLTEIEFEDDFEITANMHADNYADFEISTISIVRITITTGTGTDTSFDEISLMGFPKGEADKWLKDDTSSQPETSVPSHEPEGELDSFLIGTWGADDPEIIEEGGDDYKVVFTFNADGTGSYLQAGVNLPFTWYTADKVLYMNVTLVGALVKPYTYENDILTMSDEDGRPTQFVKF